MIITRYQVSDKLFLNSPKGTLSWIYSGHIPFKNSFISNAKSDQKNLELGQIIHYF